MIQIHDTHKIGNAENLKNKYKFNFCPHCMKNDPETYVDLEVDDAVILERVEYYDTQDKEFYEGYWVTCDACGLHTDVVDDEDEAVYDWNRENDLAFDYISYEEPRSDEAMGYEKWFSEFDMRYHYRKI